MPPHLEITALSNPRVKQTIKLRQRSHRDALRQMLIEGYRECRRALDCGYRPQTLFYCEKLWLKHENEPAIIAACQTLGADICACSEAVFRKMAYRERPDGLIMVGPQLHRRLEELQLPPNALVIVAQAIEKPGNLGTILRSADAAGVHAVLVCDRCTDLHNPNVVRASTGTLFTVPVIECSSAAAQDFLRQHNFCIVATTPHTDTLHYQLKLTGNIAIAVGTEQYGLDHAWLELADARARIPMCGVADSLNVAAATTILLYEALRQRLVAGIIQPPPAHTH